MSFVQARQTGNRPAIVVAVAALHGAAIFALVTGLGVKVIETFSGNLPTHNYPAEKDPPPPEAKPDEKVPDTAQVRVPQRQIDIPIKNAVFEIAEFDLPDIPDIPTGIIENPYIPDPVETFPPVAARPANDTSNWVTTNDYPTRDLRQGNQGTVRVRLRIAEDGRVSGCDIVQSSGHPGLDTATCKHISRRARFKPAIDDMGERTVGTYTRAIRWVIPD